jgi:hypothetical protein
MTYSESFETNVPSSPQLLGRRKTMLQYPSSSNIMEDS